jgi:hypothetical protein
MGFLCPSNCAGSTASHSSFIETWVVIVQEMHEDRKTKSLPILLGRQPSTSKPTTGLIAVQTRYEIFIKDAEPQFAEASGVGAFVGE